MPLLIGLNWVVLIYTSNAIISHLTNKKIWIVVGGSVLMVLYDVILEIAAPFMMMWEFQGNHPPLNNYLMWFVLSIVFHLAMVVFKINTENKPARNLFIIQMVFFLIIVVYSLLFIK